MIPEGNPWQGSRVLVTGAAGTVGRELMRQVLNHRPTEVIGLDNNESALFFLRENYRLEPRIRLALGDIRDRDTMIAKTRGVDVVLHAAALKHVILCEEAPQDAVQTNILGTQNVIHAAIANGVKRVLFTSSDKAVNPSNVMGTSKLMGERLMTAANAHRRSGDPIFVSTRFGNVLGSRGSVIPLFRQQIAAGGPVTLTDRHMTRFIMTLAEAVRLTMDSVWLAHGGEVFVTKMPIARIDDLAAVMIEEISPRYGYAASAIDVQEIGSKAGEKLYEELMNEEEIRRTLELDRYFVVLPAFRSVYQEIDYRFETVQGEVDRAYNSALEPPLTREALRAYLREHNLLTGEDEV